MTLINITPHDIIIYDASDLAFTPRGYVLPEGASVVPTHIIPASGTVARAEQHTDFAGVLSGTDIPLVRTRYGKPVNLPEPMHGTYYIVSVLTIQSARAHGRTTNDLLTVADTVRDSSGRVVGCCALNRND